MPAQLIPRHIEESLSRRLEWAVFEPNDERSWTKIRGEVEGIMLELFRSGALAGSKPEEAYFVKCGRDTMTQDDFNNGVINIEIGFAPLKPAEFVIITIRQKTSRVNG